MVSMGFSEDLMELRSGPVLRSSQYQQLGHVCIGGGDDLISSLPDDLLLLILARLPCASAAARTGVLSHRWHGLWARLRRIVLRNVPFSSLGPALARISVPARAIEIRIRDDEHGRPPAASRVNLLLCSVAQLEPEELVFTLPGHLRYVSQDVDLPCLRRATSVVLESLYFVHVPAAEGEFAALETLLLSCCMVELDNLLHLCPRLRVLRLNLDVIGVDGTSTRIHSPLLQELIVKTKTVWTRVDIVAPVLKKLTVSIYCWEEADITVTAPMLEKVWWSCVYNKGAAGFGLWCLQKLTLQSKAKLPFLCIHARIFSSLNFPIETANLTLEIDKHMVASFSLLELHLTTKGHAFGALVFKLLGMDRIRGTRKLKVVLLFRSKMEEGCPPDWPCEPTNWSSQAISLIALEEVEILGLEGADHELDFIRNIFRCSPNLKKLITKMSPEVSIGKHGCTKIREISREYPSVERHVHFGPGFN